MTKKNYLILAILFFSIQSLTAQKNSDLESWSSIGIQKELFNKSLTLSLSEELRLNNNSTALDFYFTELGLDYQFLSYWNIALGYRIIRENESDQPNSKHSRWQTDLSFKHKINRFKLSYRLRYQQKYSSSENYNPITKIRFRVKTAYNIKNWKWDPYITTELFHVKETIALENYVPSIDQNDISINGFQKIRFTLGTSKKFKNIGKLNLFYRFENEFDSYPYTIANMNDWTSSTHDHIGTKNWHIIGLNFNFNL